MPNKRVLVLLEESRPDALPWPDDLGGDTVKKVIDDICESFENINTQATTCGAYDQFIPLIDVDCTYEKVKSVLVNQTVQGNTIDLIVLGHGSNDNVVLNGGNSMTGDMIRDIGAAAVASGCRSVNLRMVFMCNCFGSTLNCAWLDIGARVAVGPKKNDYMPEPMTTDFLTLWAEVGQNAADAASHAYDLSKTAYWAVAFPVIGILYEAEGWFGDSELIVSGDAAVTKKLLYPGKPALPEDVTNLPPFLKEVCVAQPLIPANPAGFAAFAGRVRECAVPGKLGWGRLQLHARPCPKPQRADRSGQARLPLSPIRAAGRGRKVPRHKPLDPLAFGGSQGCDLDDCNSVARRLRRTRGLLLGSRHPPQHGNGHGYVHAEGRW